MPRMQASLGLQVITISLRDCVAPFTLRFVNYSKFCLTVVTSVALPAFFSSCDTQCSFLVGTMMRVVPPDLTRVKKSPSLLSYRTRNFSCTLRKERMLAMAFG